MPNLNKVQTQDNLNSIPESKPELKYGKTSLQAVLKE